MSLIVVNLCCSVVMALSGLWLLTETAMPRIVRIFCALIACGGSVNSLGMVADLFQVGGFAYGDIWPGEAIINVGLATMLGRWTWLYRKRRARFA